MNETAVKVTFTGLLAVLSVWLEALAVPVVLLILAMVIDYATGLLAASHRGKTITSYRSVNGIAKKVCHLLLVAVGLILDSLIFYVRESFGLAFPWSFVIAAVVAVWLTANEIISILENIQDIGVILPAWLLPLAKNLKGKVEAVAPEQEVVKQVIDNYAPEEDEHGKED